MENITLSLEHRITTHLLNYYYGILEMTDIADSYNLIVPSDDQPGVISDEEMEEVVDRYLENLKETIDEMIRKNSVK
jgi:hypothetical protein